MFALVPLRISLLTHGIMALLEARPYRPFKSSEEYLEAMKEDLAEWLNTIYPELLISAEAFMDRLDTGVALCKHANYVRQAAENYLVRRQARNKSITRSMTSGLVGPVLAMGRVHFLPTAKSGTFFARDNVSNFITWCRKSLKIIECLLFETDDLIMRKNEKHVILCLLEVARRGAKFGMLAPMLIQMERQIDREIAADNKANNIVCGTKMNCSGDEYNGSNVMDSINNIVIETDLSDTDSENGDENEEAPMLMYGPQPQIITNDLKSLDEMVRDLVEKCTCPSQFPMIRVSEGKYRIGDTKVLIFVRILRSHVMVRVGGGWDTLAHYLDKHDPCRCKSQHRSSIVARLIPHTNQSDFIELHKAQVIFERSPPSAFNIQTSAKTLVTATDNNLAPMNYEAIKARSRSPTPQRKFLNHLNISSGVEKQSAGLLPSPSLSRRSYSPSSRRLIDNRKKHTSLDSCNNGPKSLPLVNELNATANHGQIENINPICLNAAVATNTPNQRSDANANSNKFEDVSDNGSEISDEGYRSLGITQSNRQKRESFHSHASMEAAESNVRLDHTSSHSQLSPIDDSEITTKSAVTLDYNSIGYSGGRSDRQTTVDANRSQAILSTSKTTATTVENKFENSGIFITDKEITVNIAHNTGLRKTDFSTKIFGGGDVFVNTTGTNSELRKDSTIRCLPNTIRRRNFENKSCSSSLQDLHTHNALPVFNRKQLIFCSMRKPNNSIKLIRKTSGPPVGNVTNTHSNRTVSSNGVKKRPTISTDNFVSEKTSSPAVERNSKIRSSQILYDSNGRRVKACTTSLTTSPVKSYTTSPLAQQLLEAASSAKNDAQILEKMKNLLSRYASSQSNKTDDIPSSVNKLNTMKPPAYEDFTSAWVHSNGNLDHSSSCSTPAKARFKRSSAASSVESTHLREMSVIVSPRRERGKSKIPGPILQHT